MNRFSILKLAFGLAVGSGAMYAPAFVSGNEVMDDCSKELLHTYFPEALVNETLKKFNVPQDKWASIDKDLSGKEGEIVRMVEEKAEKMTPNPLKDPSQRMAAVKIFRETLLSVFSQAMNKNGITDERQIQAMLDDIQQQKAKMIVQCLEKHKAMPQRPPSAGMDEKADSSSGEQQKSSDRLNENESSSDDFSSNDSSDDLEEDDE